MQTEVSVLISNMFISKIDAHTSIILFMLTLRTTHYIKTMADS